MRQKVIIKLSTIAGAVLKSHDVLTQQGKISGPEVARLHTAHHEYPGITGLDIFFRFYHYNRCRVFL
jgi:hypothetical protein